MKAEEKTKKEDLDIVALNEAVKQESQSIKEILSESGKWIVGQKEMVESLLMGLITEGHILVEGVPGLAKTLTISAMSRASSLDFQRIQFTPDLLPTDLIGTMIFNPKTGDFAPKKGPIFTHIVLADEINRAPAKVQSALLEAMAEKQVTIGDDTYSLNKPFLVLATQNPLEQEGTYPLPEAQLDRFMFKVIVNYPNKSEELEILNKMSGREKPEIQAQTSKEDLLKAQKRVDEIYLKDELKNYIVDIVLATRKPREYGLRHIENLIEVGASPRATINLTRASKAHAFLNSRGYVTAEDIKAVIYNVLRHRLILTYEAEAEEVKSEEMIKEILNQIEVS